MSSDVAPKPSCYEILLKRKGGIISLGRHDINNKTKSIERKRKPTYCLEKNWRLIDFQNPREDASMASH